LQAQKQGRQPCHPHRKGIVRVKTGASKG